MLGKCSKYEKIKCLRQDKKVGTCNLCPKISKCGLDKYFYYAKQAHKKYLYTLTNSREGVNLTTKKFLILLILLNHF